MPLDNRFGTADAAQVGRFAASMLLGRRPTRGEIEDAVSDAFRAAGWDAAALRAGERNPEPWKPWKEAPDAPQG